MPLISDEELAALKATNERLADLVRYNRADLHQTGLISDEEYAEIMQNPGAVNRLEGYDAARESLRKDAARKSALIDEIVALANKYGWNGVDNSKILAVFLEGRLQIADNLEKAAIAWTPTEFQDRQYDLMNAVQMQIVGELERAGFDPCPAIKIASAATSEAWDIWQKFIAENEKLRKAVSPDLGKA